MKKIFLLLLILSLIFVDAEAQRIQQNKQNGGTLTYSAAVITDNIGEDTIIAKPNAWRSIYRVTLTTNQNWKAPFPNNAQLGDGMEVYVSGTPGTILRLIPSTGWNNPTIQSFTLSSNFGAGVYINLRYNGKIWLLINTINY